MGKYLSLHQFESLLLMLMAGSERKMLATSRGFFFCANMATSCSRFVVITIVAVVAIATKFYSAFDDYQKNFVLFIYFNL